MFFNFVNCENLRSQILQRYAMKQNMVRFLAPVVVIACAAGGYALLQVSKPEPEKNKKPLRLISVYTDSVKQENVSLKVVTQGNVRARIQIDMVSQVGGRIMSVSPEFIEGGLIEPGVPLLKIEAVDYRLQLGQVQAYVADAEVVLQQAIADADVARKQLRNDPSASPLALKKPQLAGAKANLAAAKANLEQAQINLQRTDVSLPFHGRVISTRVDTGQYITPGTLLGQAFATEVVEVRLPLSDSQLASLGLPIGYTAPTGGGLDVNFFAEVAGKTHQWEGKLTRLDASIDPNTRMLYASAEVIEPYGKNVSKQGMPLAVGLFVEAQIEGRSLDAALIIPRSALRAGDVVFLIKDGKLEVRPVTLVHSSPDRAVVASGLAAGEKVITSPIRNPIPGMALAEASRAEASRAEASRTDASRTDSN
jgi:RND family efflux transporter MFP subunit